MESRYDAFLKPKATEIAAIGKEALYQLDTDYDVNLTDQRDMLYANYMEAKLLANYKNFKLRALRHIILLEPLKVDDQVNGDEQIAKSNEISHNKALFNIEANIRGIGSVTCSRFGLSHWRHTN